MLGFRLLLVGEGGVPGILSITYVTLLFISGN